MDRFWHRVLVAVLAAAALGTGGVRLSHAQEPLPDYLRPSFGPRGVGTADWVFVPRMVTVFQKPRPDYDPVGIRLGNFDVATELGLGATYDDNVFATDSDKTSDGIGTLNAGIRVRSDWPVHLLGFEAGGLISRNLDETSEDYEVGRVSAFGRLDITGVDTVFASAGFRREVELRDDPENQGGGITEFNRILQQVGYVHQFSRVNVRINTLHQRLNYLKNADDDRDRDEIRVGGRITYALSPRFTPFAQAGYRITDFDDEVSDTGIDRDSTDYTIAVGTRILITEILLAEVSVGVSHVDFEDPTLKSDTAPAFDGRLIWNITPLTSIILQGFQTQHVSTQSGTAGRIDTGGGLRIEHELLSNLLVFGSTAYTNEDFQDTNRNDDVIEAAIGGEFLVNENLSFSARYQFEDRLSTDPTEEFARNSVLFQARLQY